MKVKAWKEQVVIPTYEIGTPEKNPIFLEKRVYQGSSGKVYPLPVIEKIHDEKTDRHWNAVFLENRYLKIMILPELGGRIQMAYDKIKERHFIYYNRVIKPALVGLTGPWISGGIEFNWPQHHRPSTYDPVEWDIETYADGSVTVWCSEVERMFRTKGMAGFTLYPDRAYLEIKVKLYNRTDLPQTFLWWANPALHVNDHYQSVFPPDVHAVFDHGKRDVSTFPIATGTYYKVDYSAGVDISRYKNIPVPTSYMAIKSKYDFVGGYEHDTGGGIVHVADHHISPGKKQWTWGHGDFGQAWDRNLTDEDGPYVELMCGVYTDNQPDFSWLQPNEEKAFEQYFMPYRELGIVKNASKDAILNLEFSDNVAHIRILATGTFANATITLTTGEETIFARSADLSPHNMYEQRVSIPAGTPQHACTLIVRDSTEKNLLTYRPEKETSTAAPEPAKPARPPRDVENNEQLYLTGLHLEQYRHATYDPRDYYDEALRRDPGDVRNNNALGLWLLRNGRFAEAERYFHRAVDTLTERNPNPYDGEPLYNLGLSLLYQDKTETAYDAFAKASWNGAWQDTAWYQMSRIDAQQGHWSAVLHYADKSLTRNTRGQKVRHLKAMALRRSGDTTAAADWIHASLRLDSFNVSLLYELYLIDNREKSLAQVHHAAGNNIHNYIEYALDYATAGQYDEAAHLLRAGLDRTGAQYPIVWYMLGWCAFRRGHAKEGMEWYRAAESKDPSYCFPHRLEEIRVLQHAIGQLESAPRALYYLGNLWYDKKQYDAAIECWERSAQADPGFPTTFRNLALARFNKQQRHEEARQAMVKAFDLDKTDHRILMELDQLYKRLNHPPQERLERLEQYPSAFEARDDLYLERVFLKNMAGQHAEALDLLMKRNFHPWEGGEGKVTGQYVQCHTGLALKALDAGSYGKALEHLQAAEHYPENLGEGKLFGARENDIYFWKGEVYDKTGRPDQAEACREIAAKGPADPAPAIFYNDQPPDKIFYKGLALLRLGRTPDARAVFDNLIDYGERHREDRIRMDYFAVSLPDLLIWEDDLDYRNRIHCVYMTGLGRLGMGELEAAEKAFAEVLEEDHCHQGAFTALKLLQHPDFNRILGTDL